MGMETVVGLVIHFNVKVVFVFKNGENAGKFKKHLPKIYPPNSSKKRTPKRKSRASKQFVAVVLIL